MAAQSNRAVDTHADLPAADHDDQPIKRLESVVAVIIALATLLAAVAGLLQAEASELAEDHRLRATTLGLEAAASVQYSQEQAQIEYQLYIRAVEQRTNAANAQLRALLAEEGTSAERRLLLEQERWERLADTTAGETEIGPASEFGPDRDAAFPARYFAAARQEGYRLNALQDAHNELANVLDERGAAYTAILAVLAVSLYLFGLTLAVREQLLRRAFLAVALVLMVAAAAWTALNALQPTPGVDPEAASAYAAARVASDTAYDADGHAEARRHYDRAIELRPSFAQAYLERASAIIVAATPQQSGLVSVVPVDALRAGLADLQRARELGLATARSEGSLGFYSFLEGIQTGERAALEQSVAASRRAIELVPGEPVYRLNLGVALVALERWAEAEAAYREAVSHILYIDGDVERPRADPWREQIWLAGALTDLQVLLHHRPDLNQRVGGYKEFLVGRVSAAAIDMPPPSPASVGELRPTVFPAQAQWEAPVDGYDAARDVVSTQWYHRPPGVEEWAVIPEISGSDAPSADAETGGYYRLSRYLGTSQPAACLAPGNYRVEVYLNGRLAATAEVEPSFGDLEAVVARDVTLAFCRPAEWQPIDEQLPGLLHGYRSGDGERGVYGLRFDLPRSFGELPELAEVMIDSTVESMPDLFPAQPEFVEESGTIKSYFLGLDRTAWRWYDYGTGWVRAAGGVEPDGAVILGLVFGPYEWFDGPEPDAVHDSMIRYE